MTPEIGMCLTWWREWRDYKILPYDGDLLDQPVYIYEVITLCETTYREMETLSIKQQRLELERWHAKSRRASS